MPADRSQEPMAWRDKIMVMRPVSAKHGGSGVSPLFLRRHDMPIVDFDRACLETSGHAQDVPRWEANREIHGNMARDSVAHQLRHINDHHRPGFAGRWAMRLASLALEVFCIGSTS